MLGLDGREMQINSTQLAGLLAFVPAAIAAAFACVEGARRQGARVAWAAMAIIYCLMSIEVVVMTRTQITDAKRGWLRNAGVYLDRRPAQIALLVIGISIVAFGTRMITRLAPTRCLVIATCATAALVMLFIVETISFHDIDMVLYRPAGPVLLIGWLWLACGWTSTAAAVVQRS